ncbi:hypothetical protein BCIN_16g01010 [Botrytis cinerea B05.10]|uniref:Uncharacterized protein n=2 Tax=Botryotinia fuckeliana (strain B05.10) TaxID=332648 RepID=A0A384K623_BOTFB|nr:hypothetical protein BCIN_16g01010 [Botrytis cinerea B05.10]ATZ58273.1 hypothetical protein BCIN_16g01010 [Botrytis cinerea B05.10]
MVYTESRFSHLSYSTVGHGRTDSPTIIDNAFTPVSGIGIAIPYPVLQRTFLFDATPPPSPVYQKFKYPSSVPPSTPQGKKDLINFDKLPEWSQDNPHIHSGYRQISHSTSTCLYSCFQIHNETFNIWSHFIPCILFIILEGIIMYYLNTRYPNATIKDYIVFSFFILCATICLGISSIFHSLISHSQKGHDLWLKLDYVGIVFLIIGCFISAVYMSFFCQQTLQYAYCGMVSYLSLFHFCILMKCIDFNNVEHGISFSPPTNFSRSSMAFFPCSSFLCNSCFGSYSFRSYNSTVWMEQGHGTIGYAVLFRRSITAFGRGRLFCCMFSPSLS